jgi:hypothetical protein
MYYCPAGIKLQHIHTILLARFQDTQLIPQPLQYALLLRRQNVPKK